METTNTTAIPTNSPDVTSETNVDVRSETEKQVDAVLGATGTTQLDKQFARILRHASDLFLNGKQTIKYLTLADECRSYLNQALEAGVKRKDAIARITDRLHDAGIGVSDIRVNDWLAVLGVALNVAKVDSLSEIDKKFWSKPAYRTLAMLKVGVTRDDKGFGGYIFKNGWADFIRSAIDKGLNGKRLVDAIDANAKAVTDLERFQSRAGLSPEQVDQRDRADLAKLRDKQISAIQKSIETLRDKAIEANMSQEDILNVMTNRGVITVKPTKAPTIAEMMRALTPDNATEFASCIVERGNPAIIATIVSQLVAWQYLHEESSIETLETVNA